MKGWSNILRIKPAIAVLALLCFGIEAESQVTCPPPSLNVNVGGVVYADVNTTDPSDITVTVDHASIASVSPPFRGESTGWAYFDVSGLSEGVTTVRYEIVSYGQTVYTTKCEVALTVLNPLCPPPFEEVAAGAFVYPSIYLDTAGDVFASSDDPNTAVITPTFQPNASGYVYFNIEGVEEGITTVRVQTITYGASPSTTECETVVNVIRGYDLEVQKYASSGVVTQGDILVYTINVFNWGPDDANSVYAGDSLPPLACYSNLSAATTHGSCSLDGNFLSCNLGTLAYGQQAVITVTGRVECCETFTNEVSISSMWDLNYSNDYDRAVVTCSGGGVIDPFEPDDDPFHAVDWSSSRPSTQPRTFHDTSDRDWVRVFLIDGHTFNLEGYQVGQQADVAIDLFYKHPDGPLEQIGYTMNQQDNGPGLAETFPITIGDGQYPQGFYYIRFTPGSAGAIGPDSGYIFQNKSPSLDDLARGSQRPAPPSGDGGGGGDGSGGAGGNGYMIVCAVDRLHTNLPPEGAFVTVAGVDEVPFTNQLTYFTIPEGTYTVTVSASDGNVAREDPSSPDAVDDPLSEFYGNPKERVIVEAGWDIAVYQFTPYGRVDGVVRDATTGDYIQDVAISFEATSGILTNNGQVFSAFQDNLSYTTDWVTDATGFFPTNVLLPTTNFHLTLEASGYETGVVSEAVKTLQLKEEQDLGTFYLTPIDSDGDGMADAWEIAMLGGIGANPGDDNDGDGKNNLSEYLDGTDPDDANSVLSVLPQVPGEEMTIYWAASPGRQYEVMATESIITPSWYSMSGPLEAAPGQTNLSWTETNSISSTSRYYAIERR